MITITKKPIARAKAYIQKLPKKLKQSIKPKAKTKSKAKKPREKRKTAKDFGDDPKIRQKHGERAKFTKKGRVRSGSHSKQPWEVRYAKEKAKKDAAKKAKKPTAKKKPVSKAVPIPKRMEQAKQQRKQATKMKQAAEKAKTPETKKRKAKEAISKAKDATKIATKVIESKKAPPSAKKTARATRRAAKKTEDSAVTMLDKIDAYERSLIKDLRKRYPESKYKIVKVQKHLLTTYERRLDRQIKRQGLDPDDVIVTRGVFGESIFMIPKKGKKK